MRLVIASRKSDLARLQSLQVGQALQKKHPDLRIEYHWRESLGDKNLSDPLWKMPDKGVFTEDFVNGLLTGEFDLVVHSWKDLPVESRQGTSVVATLPREDVRDLLLFKKKDLGQKKITLLSSSPRRIYNLDRHLRDLLPKGVDEIRFESVRGNVQTRVRKMRESEASGLIVAKAALDRLLTPQLPEDFQKTQSFLMDSMKDFLWMVLPISLNPTAAAQGALAIEIRSDRQDVKNILASIHCEETFRTVSREREQLQTWGGGCHQKIGVNILSREYGDLFFAQGQRDNGEIIDREEIIDDPTYLGESYFPLNPQQALWFDRKPVATIPSFSKYNAHWVSKTEALPDSVHLTSDQLIWTSGVKTWKKLAQRGLWVSGSNESLGEKEKKRLERIDSISRQWCKWSHEEGEANKEMPLIKTYRLLPREERPVLAEATQHFYWMSGSSFREALRWNPWLVHKTHWCGPGLTFEVISQELNKNQGRGAVRVAMTFEQWQKRFKSTL